jgi:hypothetical protein
MSAGGTSVAGSSTLRCRAKLRTTISRRLQWTWSVLRGVEVAQASAASVVMWLMPRCSR